LSHSDLYVEVDRSAYTNALAENSPVTKTFFALSALILCVSALSARAFIVPIILFIICTTLTLGLAKVKPHLYLNMFIYPTFMIILSCIFIALFFGVGEPLTQITLPWTIWTIHKSGISMALNIFFSVMGSLSCLFFLVLTTSITDLSLLLRRVHVPTVLVELAILIYRYIFMFMEISHTMTTAQKLRLGGTGWMKKIREVSLLAGNLFIRTLEQGERTFVAMNARGYDGNIYALEEFPKPKKTMIAAIILFDILIVAVIFLTLNIGVI